MLGHKRKHFIAYEMTANGQFALVIPYCVICTVLFDRNEAFLSKRSVKCAAWGNGRRESYTMIGQTSFVCPTYLHKFRFIVLFKFAPHYQSCHCEVACGRGNLAEFVRFRIGFRRIRNILPRDCHVAFAPRNDKYGVRISPINRNLLKNKYGKDEFLL